MSASPRPLTTPPPPGNPYAELLSGTRAMAREHRTAREVWFNSLPLAGREDALFELEVLLKASACFSNPRNHPGPPRRSPVVAQSFRDATILFRDGMLHAVTLARQLLGGRNRAYVFHRYLETVLPEDNLRTRLLGDDGNQAHPEESLLTLRHGLTTAAEVLEGILRAQRVPFRSFYATLSMVEREVGRNTFFNPLRALEFLPEFDRISSSQVLDLIHSVTDPEARRLVALTFLSLFRQLRYVRLLGRIAQESPLRRRRAYGRIYLVLSVVRSDARALSDYLRRRAGLLLAESFERDVLRVPAGQIQDRAASLRATGYRFIGIKSALEGIAGNLRLELRRAFQHDLPPPDAIPAEAEFKTVLLATTANLRPALQNSILFLGKALGVSLEEGGVFDDQAARRETAERLRRDVWMFAQIVRAFGSKAQQTPSDDRWSAVYTFHYVREFLAYFRAMGYPVLRAADYPRFDAFMAAIGHLEDTDLVDPARLETAIDECVAFHGFLLSLFDDISRRDVLADQPFDRRAAAAALRLYLGDHGA